MKIIILVFKGTKFNRCKESEVNKLMDLHANPKNVTNY